MKKLLVTGGFGKIGKHFIQKHNSQYYIRAADIAVDHTALPDNVEVVQADLTNTSICEQLCAETDVVVHLAGIVDPASESEDLLDANIAMTKNIFRAAAHSSCQRIIFASSAQAIEGYPQDVQVSKNMPVKPKNIYGVSKCFGEALAAYYAHYGKVSALCLRIGAYEFPEDHKAMSSRDLSAFLHPDDFNQLLLRCIEVQNVDYEILGAISNNRYKRLDISDSIKIGYQPQADAFDLFAYDDSAPKL